MQYHIDSEQSTTHPCGVSCAARDSFVARVESTAVSSMATAAVVGAGVSSTNVRDVTPGNVEVSSANERESGRDQNTRDELEEQTTTGRALPVFLINDTLPDYSSPRYTVVEICECAEKVAGYDNIVGAQLIRNLWRIYPTSNEARMSLLSGGIELRGSTIYPRDKNPFIVREVGGNKPLPTTKLIIGNIPLSYSNTEIEEALKRLPTFVPASELFEEKGRDSTGKLRKWKTGRRYIYMVVPPEPLPKLIAIGDKKAYLTHKEQFQDRACRICLRHGHAFYECTSAVRCRTCRQEGHKAGAPECGLAPPPSFEDRSTEREMTTEAPEASETAEDHRPPTPPPCAPPPPPPPPIPSAKAPAHAHASASTSVTTHANAPAPKEVPAPEEKPTEGKPDAERGRSRTKTKQTTIDRARLLVATRALSRSESVGEVPSRSPSGKRSQSQRRTSRSKERTSKHRKTTEQNDEKQKDQQEPEEQEKGNDT